VPQSDDVLMMMLIDSAFVQDVILCCLQLERVLHVKNGQLGKFGHALLWLP
jgi:hypothetical protein